MTVDVPGQEGTVVPYDPSLLDSGLEDFDLATDAVMPRISIQHREGRFKDNLSGTEFPTLRCVILGLVKQRILWHTTMDDNDKPMCKSPDFDFGFPTLEGNNGKTFPWPQSHFAPDQFGKNSEGFVQLPCANCNLKEWGSHPDGKKPWCSEQHTLPIMYDPSFGEAGDDFTQFIPAMLTLQKTGIKPSKTYLTSFARTKTPTYTALTQITLTTETRGQTVYAVPTLSRIGAVDQQYWPEFSKNYRSIREFVRMHPTSREDDEVTAPTSNEWQAPQTVAPATDDPWAAPVPQATPPQAQPAAQPQAAPQAPAAQAQPVAPPAAMPQAAPEPPAAPAPPTLNQPTVGTGPAPVAAPQAPAAEPVAPAATATVPAAQAAPAPVAPAAAADDDLPF